MRIKQVAKSSIIVIILLFLVCSLVACDPRRELKDSEITALLERISTIILEDNNWNNSILYNSIDGRLIIHDDYVEENPNENLFIDLINFKEEITNLFMNDSLVNNGGFLVYNGMYLLFLVVDDESSDIHSLSIEIYSNDSIIVEPEYKTGIEYKTLGAILNLDLDMLEHYRYSTNYEL